MRLRLVGLLVISLSSAALAQPGPDSPPQPGAPGAPAPDPNAPPTPYGLPGAPPPGAPPYPPPGTPVYAQPIPPGAQPPAPPPDPGYAYHRGVTAEANLGVGYIHLSSGGDNYSTDASVALGASVGGWLSPRLALLGRFSMIVVHDHDDTPEGGSVTHSFLGPEAAFWVTPHAWIAGGVGWATIRDDETGCDDNCSQNGFAFDFRVGYAFGPREHQVDISGEVTPAFYSNNGQSGTFTNLSLQIGYRFL